MENEIMVSVLCLAYNHENYIAKAIESFLNQKTNFFFEIIINDDNSTDGTLEILNSYQLKYKHMIRVIRHEENQYSKGVKIIKDFLLANAKGRYIAFCEGDDFWTNENKLQLQYDYMESNLDYSMCVHACEIVNANTEKKIGQKCPFSNDGEITTAQIIAKVRRLFPFNSIFFRSSIIPKLPEYTFSATIDDFPLSIVISTFGKVYYFSSSMSAYRANSNGSWTSQLKKENSNYSIYNSSVISFFHTLDEKTNGIYHTVIQEKIDEFFLEKLVFESNIKSIKQYYLQYYRNLSFVSKFKLYAKSYTKVIKKMRKKDVSK